MDPWVRKVRWRREKLPTPVFLGLPGGSAGKEYAYNQETWVQSLGCEDPLEKGKATHSSILYSPWGQKESDTTERLSLHFLSLSCEMTSL